MIKLIVIGCVAYVGWITGVIQGTVYLAGMVLTAAGTLMMGLV